MALGRATRAAHAGCRQRRYNGAVRGGAGAVRLECRICQPEADSVDIRYPDARTHPPSLPRSMKCRSLNGSRRARRLHDVAPRRPQRLVELELPVVAGEGGPGPVVADVRLDPL